MRSKPPYLKLILGDVVADRAKIEYEDMETAKEKQEHQERLAIEMLSENCRTIKNSGLHPIFYIERMPSKINEIDFTINDDDIYVIMFMKKFAK